MTLSSYCALWFVVTTLNGVHSLITTTTFTTTAQQPSQENDAWTNATQRGRRLYASCTRAARPDGVSCEHASNGLVTAPFVKTGLFGLGPVEFLGPSNTGSIQFAISCDQDTTLELAAQVEAPDGQSNSAFVHLDSQPRQVWHFTQLSTSLTWQIPHAMLTATKGEHTLWVTGRESGLKIGFLRIIGSTCSFAHVSHALTSIAANSASLSSPFVATEDHVQLPEGGGVHGSAADFTIHCQKQSDLTFQMEVIAPNGNADSVFIGVGTVGRVRWDTGLSQTWSWSAVSPSVAVSAGSHKLRVWGREDGIKIRVLKLVNGEGRIGCFFTAQPEPPSESPAQALEDTVVSRMCAAATESHCLARSGEVSRLHGIQCAWTGKLPNRCQISTQEPACMAATKKACQERARAAASGTCVWSGSMCYAFKQIGGCEFRDPSTCDVDVALQLASTGNVDPVAQESFDWNGQTADILREFAVGSLIDVASGIPVIGGFLGATGSIATAFAGTDTSSSLCEDTEFERRGACLFRHIAEYLDRYVTERLEQEKIAELRDAVNQATNGFERLQTIIDFALGEGRDLMDVTREDFDPETDREQIDELLNDYQHDMLQRLNFDFMNTETVYAPFQAVYTAMFATVTFQYWTSQIVFNPTYHSAGYVQTMIDEIDSVTEWVLEQMSIAKQYRLDNVGEGSGTYRSQSSRIRERRWHELKDEFPECPWTGPEVDRKTRTCDIRGRTCYTSIYNVAQENARMCLQQRRDWVSWSQDTYWREALQMHLNAWQDLRNMALEWQKSF